MRKAFKMDSPPVASAASALASGTKDGKHKADVLSTHASPPILVTA
jgi:hypothetical protein